MHPAISVIVPAYNGENFLRECLNSLLTQSLKDIQIVCVNDGSTDGTAQILAAYARQHHQITVVTQENGGLSAARNAGIAAATGEYLQFLDCDDTLRPDALERLYERASRDQLDMLFFDGETIYAQEELKAKYPGYADLYKTKIQQPEAPMSGPKLFVRLVNGRSYRASACMYLLRREFLQQQGFKFIRGIYYEDNAFTLQCLLSAQRTGVETQPFYQRTLREDSIVTQSKNFKHARSYYICQNEIQHFLLNGKFDAETMRCAAQQVAVLRSSAVQAYHQLPLREKLEAEKQYPEAVLIKQMINSMGGVLPAPSVLKKSEWKFPAKYQTRAEQLKTQTYQPDAPLVSVILPVYNVDAVLGETVTDLQRQNLQNFEMIFVDDGSTDASCEILEKAAETDARIHILHQKNLYAGVARNNGMDQAKGKYLLFLDSDDRFDHNLLLHTCACAEEENAQVVLYHADLLQMPAHAYVPAAFLNPCKQLPSHVFSAKEGRDRIFNVLNPWTKLYRHSYIKQLGVRYQPLYSSNDVFFNMVGMACAKRIAPLPEVLVHYRVGQSSNIQSKKNRAPLNVYHAFEAVKKDLAQRGVFDDFRKPFAVKAAESMIRELDTMTTLDGYRQLYQTLHEGGFAFLELSCVEPEDMAHISDGAKKLSRCRNVLEMDLDTYTLKSVCGRLPVENEDEGNINQLRNELMRIRSSYVYRLVSKLTYIFSLGKRAMRKLWRMTIS